MPGEDLDAASAGHRVGYEDPAYFSRDYKKLFGAAAARHGSLLRFYIVMPRWYVGLRDEATAAADLLHAHDADGSCTLTSDILFFTVV